MSKQNCWKFMNCGRGIGGHNADSLGICPVAAEKSADGLNGGINGGRICWAVIEGDGEDSVRCSELQRGDTCYSCAFRRKVTEEEGLINACRALDKLKDMAYNRLTISLKRIGFNYTDKELNDLFVKNVLQL